MEHDWLLSAPARASARSTCWPEYGANICGLELSNTLTSRRFVLSQTANAPPLFGTLDWLVNTTASGAESMLRALEPEASITLDGVAYDVGGLTSPSAFRAYCNRSDSAFASTAANRTFAYVAHRVSTPAAPFPWAPGTRHSSHTPWPPAGVSLAVDFALPPTSPPPLAALTLTLTYDLFDGVPLIAKRLTLRSSTPSAHARPPSAELE